MILKTFFHDIHWTVQSQEIRHLFSIAREARISILCAFHFANRFCKKKLQIQFLF